MRIDDWSRPYEPDRSLAPAAGSPVSHEFPAIPRRQYPAAGTEPSDDFAIELGVLSRSAIRRQGPGS
jgi:hypothetical protein